MGHSVLITKLRFSDRSDTNHVSFLWTRSFLNTLRTRSVLILLWCYLLLVNRSGVAGSKTMPPSVKTQFCRVKLPNPWSVRVVMFFTARRYASAVLAVIVCLSVRLSVFSVRLSVTSRSCTKMAKPRIRLTTPYDSPETLVLRCPKSWRNSHDITPNGGAK